jgi:CDP-glucose 4,6-dehydratase
VALGRRALENLEVSRALSVSRAFWSGRRVFLTGHTGFKGSWLSLWLQALGADVTGYALKPPTRPSLFDLARVARGMRSIIADVRDSSRLRKALVASRPQIVIHMAAQSLVRESYADPVGTYSTNVMGTLNLLEAARAASGVRAILVVTSDKCYENRERRTGYREDEPLGGRDPYSSSKACAELVTRAYRDSFYDRSRAAVASVRAGNVIGGGDWSKDRLVPDAVRAFSAGRALRIRHPEAVRPWQHVLDPLHGYMMLAEQLHAAGAKYAGAWNFGPSTAGEKPVKWVIDHLVERWGGAARWVRDRAPRVHEAGRLNLDSAKARRELGWRPRLDLATALDWVVEWHERHARGEHASTVAAAQIARFGEAA